MKATSGVRTRTQNPNAGNKQGGYRTVGQRPGGNRYQQNNRRRYGFKDYDKPQRVRNASINIGADWKVLDEIEFSRLSKLNFSIPAVTDL
jgi:translation initiation factor 3 subunit D